MVFKPNLSVKEGLDHLAKRLDPIISTGLADVLRGRPWTVVLEILASKKGFSAGHSYSTNDLQSQLRMLTERLGDLGYPFDDPQRTVSTLGSELRIVRVQSAHMHDFSVVEAFRANDFCVRLLEYFSDEGVAEAERIRYEALTALALAEGVTKNVAEKSAFQAASTLVVDLTGEPGLDKSEDDAELEPVEPDALVMLTAPSMIGDKRLEFEPWVVIKVGEVDVLDNIAKKWAKEKVRSVVVEIVDYEGPIQLDRLAQMVAQSFGLQRVQTARKVKIIRQIQQAAVHIDSEKFVWTNEDRAKTWREFRPNGSSAKRRFTEISPIEIANAAEFVKEHRGALGDELTSLVLQTFGRRRRSKETMSHLAKAGFHSSFQVN